MTGDHSRVIRQSGTRSASLPPLPDNPLVTAIMTNYNDAEFIEETLLSVLDQDYEPIELIIVDGGSTDGSLDILHKYDSDPRVRWISEPDDGPIDAFLKGLKLATGDLAIFQSSNDIFLPGAFTALVNAFVSDPQLGFVGGWYSTMDVQGNPTESQRFYRLDRSEISVDDIVNYRAVPACLASLWRRDLIAVDGIQPDLGGADLIFQMSWFLAVAKGGGRLLAIPKLITAMRFHPNNRGVIDPAGTTGGDPRGPLGVWTAVNGDCKRLAEMHKGFLSPSQVRTLHKRGHKWELDYRRLHLHQTISLIPVLIRYVWFGGLPSVLKYLGVYVLRKLGLRPPVSPVAGIRKFVDEEYKAR